MQKGTLLADGMDDSQIATGGLSYDLRPVDETDASILFSEPVVSLSLQCRTSAWPWTPDDGDGFGDRGISTTARHEGFS